MSKSVLVNKYNKINVFDDTKIVIEDKINVSLIDILSNKEVEVNVKSYNECLCKHSDNINEYYSKCSKCSGRGFFLLNGHEVICNECQGEKYTRIHDCYLCSNKGKIVVASKMKVKLNDNYKNNEKLEYEFDDYILKLTLKIKDKDDYIIKNNDIYFTRGISYSKEEYKNKVNKAINTLKGIKYVAPEFKVKKEVVKLEGCGIDNGDFYFIFDNEIEKEKKEIYSNILINKSGYVSVEELVNNDYVIAKECVSINDNSVYIDESKDIYEDEEYIVHFNKLNKSDFIIEDGKIVYLLNLDKSDLDNDKKTIVINDEKINVSYKKNLKEEEYVNVNKVIVNKDGKKGNLLIKIIPCFENVYKISIKKNKHEVYIEDYKYEDYTLVESFKSSDYLQDYISVDKEEKVFVGNDVVYIKRV